MSSTRRPICTRGQRTNYKTFNDDDDDDAVVTDLDNEGTDSGGTDTGRLKLTRVCYHIQGVSKAQAIF